MSPFEQEQQQALKIWSDSLPVDSPKQALHDTHSSRTSAHDNNIVIDPPNSTSQANVTKANVTKANVTKANVTKANVTVLFVLYRISRILRAQFMLILLILIGLSIQRKTSLLLEQRQHVHQERTYYL